MRLMHSASRRTGSVALSLVLLFSACSSSGDESGGEVAAGSTTEAEASEVSETGNTEETDQDAPPIVTALREAGADVELFSAVGDLVTFVAPKLATGVTDPEAAVFAYFDAFAPDYGMSDPTSNLEVEDVTETPMGVVVRLRQLNDGHPVVFGELAVTVAPDGEILSVAGVVVPDAEVDEPTVSDADAVSAAETATEGRSLGPAERVVYSPAVDRQEPGPMIPAWSVPLAVDDGSVALEEVVVVSGVDASILVRAGIDATDENWDLSDAGNAVNDDGDAVFDDSTLVYEMRSGSLSQISEPDADAGELAGHFSTTWAYFLDTHGRDGHDGAGGACDIYVHVGVDWFNASSGRTCFVRFGDAAAFARSLDIVAHEFAHSVTGQTSGLVYADQSGALNEHYSDFFAAMIDRDDWVIDIVGRDLSAPSIDRFSEFVVTDRDKGGVHTNSGIGNHAGFLVAADGTNTHADTGVAVTGIGRAKAEALWYQTLLTLPRRATYPGWACATISTARAMSDLTTTDSQSVEDAMLAVELVEETDDGLACLVSAAGVSSPPAVVPPATAPPTTTPTSTTTPAEEACDLAGTWRLRDQEFFDAISSISGQAGAVIEYYGGDYVMELDADGSYVSERQEWAFRASTPDGAIVIVITSRESGTWSADATTLSIQDDGGDSTVTFFLEVGGELQPVPFSGDIPVQSDAVSGTGTYTCTPEVLTVTIDSEQGPFMVSWDRLA